MEKVTQFFSDVRDFARREPVLTRYAVAGLVTLAARYGLDLDADAVLAVLGVSVTGAAVLSRRKVTPEADLLDHDA